MEVRVVEGRSEELVASLSALWDASVRTTHHFLGEDDIARLRPCVAETLRTVPVLAVARVGGKTAGFVGVAGDKVEMLFVSPTYIGRGVGHALVHWAT